MPERPGYFVATDDPQRLIADLNGEVADGKLATAAAEAKAADALAQVAATQNGREEWQRERAVLLEEIARLRRGEDA